ncbi:MAG: hypothetical protein V4568_18690 [Pseudomonadota bacterium]
MTLAFCAAAPVPNARIVQITGLPSPAVAQLPVPPIWNSLELAGAAVVIVEPVTSDPAKARVQIFAAINAVPDTLFVALRCA